MSNTDNPNRPNLVFVFSDRQRFDTMSCYGNDWINTPKDAYIKIKDPREYIQKLKYHKNLKEFKDYLK